MSPGFPSGNSSTWAESDETTVLQVALPAQIDLRGFTAQRRRPVSLTDVDRAPAIETQLIWEAQEHVFFWPCSAACRAWCSISRHASSKTWASMSSAARSCRCFAAVRRARLCAAPRRCGNPPRTGGNLHRSAGRVSACPRTGYRPGRIPGPGRWVHSPNRPARKPRRAVLGRDGHSIAARRRRTPADRLGSRYRAMRPSRSTGTRLMWWMASSRAMSLTSVCSVTVTNGVDMTSRAERSGRTEAGTEVVIERLMFRSSPPATSHAGTGVRSRCGQ